MRAYRSPLPAAAARPRLAPATTGRRSAEPDAPPPARTSAAVLLREIVAHLRQGRTQLRDEWVWRIGEAGLLRAMSQEEIFAEATSIYDNYLDALEPGTLEAVQAYAGQLSERIVPRGVETREVVGIVLLLRDVLARSLFANYRADFQLLNRVPDAYGPAANRIATTVAAGFVHERERVIREQQEAIRELSTPVLPVRERLLILPIIGLIDGQRARQLTEQLLRAIRANRAKVVVIDITALDVMDSFAVRTLRDIARMTRLRGAETVIVGVQPEVALSMVELGLTLEGVNAALDLEEGLAFLDERTKGASRGEVPRAR